MSDERKRSPAVRSPSAQSPQMVVSLTSGGFEPLSVPSKFTYTGIIRILRFLMKVCKHRRELVDPRPAPSLAVQATIAIAYLGCGIYSYRRIKTDAIFIAIVPIAIIRSTFRGLERETELQQSRSHCLKALQQKCLHLSPA